MTPSRLLRLALPILLLPAGVLPIRAATQSLTVAIFDFDAHDATTVDLGTRVAALLNAGLSAEPNLVLVERAELSKILGEQELALSGTVSPETAAKVGYLTGAKVLVTGRVFRADKDTVIVAKIIGTETSRVYGEMVKGSSAGPLTDLTAELARKIASTTTSKAATLTAESQTVEERVRRLRQTVQGRKLPSIFVLIPEQHFGQPIRDPAAQTELLLIFQQCGFPIVDEKARDKAGVEITGEAFSVLGSRRGNLVACKARVELKVNRSAGGQLITVDRQTSVAVDVAEQTAAKAALQNAAMALAERLVPILSKQSPTSEPH